MIKDTFFSTSRFMNLCRKEMVESWRTNLLRLVMLYGIMAVLFVANAYFKYQWYPEFATDDPMVTYSLTYFVSLGWIFGLIFASMAFSNLKSKTSRLSVMMTSATPFEKYFSRWMIYTLVYAVAFIIAFMLADYTRVLISKIMFPNTTIHVASLKHLVVYSPQYSLMPDVKMFIKLLLLYFFTQSFFFLGSAVWPKNSFVKTFAAGLGIILTYALFAAVTVRILIGESIYIEKFDISIETANTIGMCIMVFFTLFNWTLAYYRFKESEIINRL
ncbi:hypothetical protein [Bacteroides sp. 519]|uniref:hypothetical protein n=1 Tax=Bacteroides sp. 519 TaxID=2302937 RepID=UPI0013D4EB1C|nr:hypothetical protein [Bacteroides sp. 519]NDV58929.1 hypothetical protein [Bacteroides sp. 519]